MGSYISDETIKLMVKKQINVLSAKVLILGITFKENCPDVRNTKVTDIVHSLKDYNQDITILDPWADKSEVMHEYGLQIVNSISESKTQKFDAIILAVAHKE